MGAASFTKISSAPDMLRYYVASTDGAVGSLTATQLIADCAAGPLKNLLTQLNTAGTWGANTATPAGYNPTLNSKLSTTLCSYTINSIGAGASYQYFNNGSANVVAVTGGVRDDTTVLGNYTSAILEIRFNHSTIR